MSVADEVGELFAVALFLEITAVEMIKWARMSATISTEAITASPAHVRQNVRQKLNKKYSFFLADDRWSPLPFWEISKPHL